MNSSCVACTVNDSAVVLVHGHTLGAAQVLQGSRLEVHAYFFRNDSTASEDSDVLQHSLATITEARGLTGSNFYDTAHVIHYQGGQRFTFNIFSDDDQWLGRLGNLLQKGQKLADVRDFLVNQQDEWRFGFNAHAVLIIDEVRRQVAAVELHSFYHVQLVF